MTIRDTGPPVSVTATTRHLVCEHCGGAFDCVLDGPCWCAQEAVRLPMPASGGDCLCPGCLREAAGSLRNVE